MVLLQMSFKENKHHGCCCGATTRISTTLLLLRTCAPLNMDWASGKVSGSPVPLLIILPLFRRRQETRQRTPDQICPITHCPYLFISSNSS